jgi:threonine aldolase
MPARLVEDHANAKLLAKELSEIAVLDVDPEQVRTNIVVVGIARTGHSSSGLVELLRTRGLLSGTVNAATLRMLTHLDVGREQMYQAARICKDVLQGQGN